MKRVLVFGTFDIFHEGHRDFLKQAKKYGDFLRVVVARDETVKNVKGVEVLHNENERKAEIEKSALANEVVLGNLDDKYAAVKEYAPDVICLGYDQKFFIEKLGGKLEEFGLGNVEIVRLKPFEPQKYKSSVLRAKLDYHQSKVQNAN